MDVRLVVVGGKTKTPEVTLELPTTIGRGRECAVTLPHPLVSRQHCELFESDGRLLVKDLGSLNGTFVGNQRISEVELPPHALLTVGNVTFRAVYEPVLADETDLLPQPVELDTKLDGDTALPAPAGPAETVDFAAADQAGEAMDMDVEIVEDHQDVVKAANTTGSAEDGTAHVAGLPSSAKKTKTKSKSGGKDSKPAAGSPSDSTQNASLVSPDDALNEFLGGLE